MFESLGEKFETLWRKLQGQGRITEGNIEEALRDVRLALLEADVNVAVVRDFVEAVKKDALGLEVLRSLSPEQHFIKLVQRELQRLLGDKPVALDLGGPSPVVVMLVGLNGAGKTTTAAKLARHLRDAIDRAGRGPPVAEALEMRAQEVHVRRSADAVRSLDDDEPTAHLPGIDAGNGDPMGLKPIQGSSSRSEGPRGGAGWPRAAAVAAPRPRARRPSP